MGRKPAKIRTKKKIRLPKVRGRKPKMDIGPTERVLIENKDGKIVVSWTKPPKAAVNKQKLRLKKILKVRGWSAKDIREAVNELWPEE